MGTPSRDAGTPSPIIYPYDQTVFPLGLLAPVVQFGTGSVPPADFKVSLDTTGFHWDGFGHVGNPPQLQAAHPAEHLGRRARERAADPRERRS